MYRLGLYLFCLNYFLNVSKVFKLNSTKLRAVRNYKIALLLYWFIPDGLLQISLQKYYWKSLEDIKRGFSYFIERVWDHSFDKVQFIYQTRWKQKYINILRWQINIFEIFECPYIYRRWMRNWVRRARFRSSLYTGCSIIYVKLYTTTNSLAQMCLKTRKWWAGNFEFSFKIWTWNLSF